MPSWKKSVMDDQVAFAAFDKLERAFMQYATVTLRGAVPHGLGVFATTGEKQGTTEWYFSPDAAVLGNMFNAVPCEKPLARRGTSLLMGESRSWGVHFPEYLNRDRGLD